MQQSNQHDSDVIDLREILAVLRKRWLVIAVLTLTALVTSGILSFFVLAPVYESKAVLLVTQAAPDKPSSSGTQDQGMEGLMNEFSRLPQMTINTYVGQLKSDAVLQRVIKKLKLDLNGYTAKSLGNSVNIAAVKDTNLIELKVTNTDPYLATRIVNTMTTEFLNFMSETNEQQMGRSVDFLKKQSTTTNEDLKKAVANLNKLEAESGGTAQLEQTVTARNQDLAKYQSQLLQVNIEYQQAVAGRRQAEEQLKNTPPTIQTTQHDTVGAVIQVDEINPAYTELKNMVNTKTVEAAEKNSQQQSLQSIVGRLSSELSGMQTKLSQNKNTMDLAQKEVTRLEEANSLMRSKIDETQISRSMKFGETSLVVVSPAMVPDTPVKPKKMLNMAIALVLGLMVSAGMAFLLNYLDNTVKSSKEVEEILGLPVLGQIPFYSPDHQEL